MDVTLVPGGDVELPDGAALGRCRDALARLTGATELVDAVLTVDGRVLGDQHVTGAPPLVHGAVLRLGPGRPDPAALAAAAPWHVAVVSGPGAGAVAVPGRDGAVHVGRADPGSDEALPDAAGSLAQPDPAGSLALPDPAGSLALPDPAVSRRHCVVVRTRRGYRVRDVGSANGTHVAASRVLRPVGRRGRRVRPGSGIHVGDGVLVVRERRGPRPAGGDGEPRAGASAAGSWTAGSPVTWAGPLVVSLGLAAVTGSPALLALGLAGPVAAAVPALVRRVRRRAAPPLSCGPDAAAAAVAAVVAAPGGEEGCGEEGCGDDAASAQPAGGRPRGADPSAAVPATAWWAWAAEGLAVVGPGRAAAARVLVAEVVAHPGSVSVVGQAAAAWSWLRWPAGASRGRLRTRWDGALATPAEGRHLVVVDGPASGVERWWAGRRAREDAALVLVTEPALAPAWCRWTLAVEPDGGAVLHGPDGDRAATVPTAGAVWAHVQSRRLAAAWASRARAAVGAGHVTPAGLPPRVGLADLLTVPTAPRGADGPTPGPCGDGVVARWAAALARPRPLTSLAVPLAATDDVVALDLLADGPHALVAGTTGSGKSELLQSWLLALALHHPPADVAMVLVDYKGGASFGVCATLPHVVGLVTDLDAETAARALGGLRTEQRRRKRLLAEAGVTDIEQLRARGPAPPRLVVVVDEFRAVAADLPDLVPGLVDLVAQGRSLGLHLVLATQRPAGAVTAQMRANLVLRVCLRVPDAADSLDVVEVPDAAALPGSTPGRAVVRRDGATQVVQTAWAALPPGGWNAPPRPGAAVTARWAGTADRAAGTGGRRPTTDHAVVLADAVRTAARSLGLPEPAGLWSAPLPAVVAEAELDRENGPPGGLALGLTDVPDATRHGTWWWSPAAGALLVAGRPRSGRTTTLRTIVRAALRGGRHVHVVGAAADLDPHPGRGTTVTADDPSRVARLLQLVLDGGAADGTVLVLDDVGDVQRALERLPRGAGADLVERAVRDGRRRGVAVVVAGAPTDVGRLAQHCGERLVLATDAHDDVLLGVPSAWAGGRTHAGRGVRLTAAGVERCHVALPGPGPVPAPTAPLLDPVGGARPARVVGPRPVRLLPVPHHVATVPSPLRVPGARGPTWSLGLGLGGDDAGPVGLDVVRGGLVVGPPGSGRSTALAALAVGAAALGLDVLALGGAPLDVPVGRAPLGGHRAGIREVGTGDDALALIRALAARPAERPVLVLVDDADALPGELDEALVRLVAASPGAAGRTVARVVAAARTDRAAAAYRGVVAGLRHTAATLVLAPSTPGSADVVGADLALVADPDRRRVPGRGAVVDRGVVVAVQVAQVRASPDVRADAAAAPGA